MIEPMPCPFNCGGSLTRPGKRNPLDSFMLWCDNRECPSDGLCMFNENWQRIERGVKAAVEEVSETAMAEMTRITEAGLAAVDKAVKTERDACADLAICCWRGDDPEPYRRVASAIRERGSDDV